MAQAYASVTGALEPSLEQGDEDVGSNVDQADSAIMAAGTPVTILEEGENDPHAPVFRDHLLFPHFCNDAM